MDHAEPVLICTPGAGLGHLVRGCAVALALGRRDISCRLVTNSPFADGIARLTPVPVTRLRNRSWPADVREYCVQHPARIVVVDTFPFGLRGEWREAAPKKIMVHIARRLKMDVYLERIESWPDRPFYQSALICEPLSSGHADWLRERVRETTELPGRIYLEPQEPLDVPGALVALLAQHRVHLIVHSGPERELQELVRAAEIACSEDPGARPVIITPLEKITKKIPMFDYFPASCLFGLATQIYTGAGYNLMAETAGYRDKHTAMAFFRTFDDQAGRLEAGWDGHGNGADAAAEVIAGFISK